MDEFLIEIAIFNKAKETTLKKGYDCLIELTEPVNGYKWNMCYQEGMYCHLKNARHIYCFQEDGSTISFARCGQ